MGNCHMINGNNNLAFKKPIDAWSKIRNVGLVDGHHRTSKHKNNTPYERPHRYIAKPKNNYLHSNMISESPFRMTYLKHLVK